MEKELTASVVPCSARPLKFDESLCVGCNRCADVCQVDIMIPVSYTHLTLPTIA